MSQHDPPQTEEICGRCARGLPPTDQQESCVFCEEAICGDCWEAFGYCPHPGADEWQERMRQAKTREECVTLWSELGAIGSSKPEHRRRYH
jgi:hypothetical protein